MQLMKRNRNILIVLAGIVLLALPAVSMAQGRGHGRGQQKKLGKFINGHDARDGRWDGRGPRSTRVGRRIRDDRIFFPRRRLRVDRDGDGDFDRDDRRFRRRGNLIFVPRNRRLERDDDRFERNDDRFDRDDFRFRRRNDDFEGFERRDGHRHGRH